ncbi:MAG: amidohydrolase [Thermodesulfobacteriota bacterium]
MTDLLIKNGLVLTQDNNRRVLAGADLAIEKDRIVALGEAAQMSDYQVAARVLDATDKLVMPGLIDAHVHLVSPLCRGLLDDIDCVSWIVGLFKGYYPLIDEENYYINARLACLEMLKTGTTTFAECGTMPGLEQAAVQAVTESGIRGVMARTMMDIYDPPGLEGFPVKEETDEALAKAEEFIQRLQGRASGRIIPGLDLHQVPNSSDELCLGSKELAEKYGVGIMAHAAVTEPLVRMTEKRFGLPDIERMEDLGLLGPKFMAVHMGWINGRELVLLKARQASVIHCPSSSMHGAYGSVSCGRFPEMLQMGVNVALGCDGANCSNHLDMVRELSLTALSHKEFRLEPDLMGPQTVLDMATLNGARALGLEDEIGSLTPGKKADIVIFDLMRPEWVPVTKANVLSNLTYSATGDSVHTVIVDGRVVVEEGRLITMDEDEVLAEAQEAFQRLLKKMSWLSS